MRTCNPALAIIFLAALVFSAVHAQSLASSATPKPAGPAASTDKPITTLPYTHSLDIASMDKSAEPCVDFYQYTCSGWIKKNPVPPDQAGWSVYGKLAQDNQRFLWGILDDLSKRVDGRTPPQQKIGDYFAACMNEPAVEKLGAAPLKPALAEIAAIKTKRDLAVLLAREHLANVTEGLFFNFGSDQDYSDSNQVIAFALAGGLGLPDRDYYTKTDAKSQEIRGKDLIHVQHMLKLRPSAKRARS